MIRLFISTKNNKRFIQNNQERCTSCNNELEILGFVTINWFKRHSPTIEFFCRHCFKNVKKTGDITEQYPVTVVQMIPIDAIPYVFRPIQITSGTLDTSVFDVSEINKMGGMTKDKTIHAGRESFEGFEVGKAIEYEEDEIDDNLLDNFFDELNEAEVIENKSIKVKQIEKRD